MRTSLRRREGMVPRALAPYQVAFPAGCQHCRPCARTTCVTQVTQPPCAVLLCCVDGHGWLWGDNGVKCLDQKMVKEVRSSQRYSQPYPCQNLFPKVQVWTLDVFCLAHRFQL